MSLYLKHKSAYSELRDANITSLPHPDTLKNILSGVRHISGMDPTSILFLKEIKSMTKGVVAGHLMMDEIKLKIALCGTV